MDNKVDIKELILKFLKASCEIKYKYPAEIPSITDEERLQQMKGYLICIEDFRAFTKNITITNAT